MHDLGEAFDGDPDPSASEPEEGGAEPDAPEGDDNNEADGSPPTKKRKTAGSAASKFDGPA